MKHEDIARREHYAAKLQSLRRRMILAFANGETVLIASPSEESARKLLDELRLAAEVAQLKEGEAGDE